MTPQQPLTVTLEAQQWQVIMNILAEGPFRVVSPLLNEIQRQAQASESSAAGMPPGMRLPGNGQAAETDVP